MGLIPGQQTKIPHAAQPQSKIKIKNTLKMETQENGMQGQDFARKQKHLRASRTKGSAVYIWTPSTLGLGESSCLRCSSEHRNVTYGPVDRKELLPTPSSVRKW